MYQRPSMNWSSGAHTFVRFHPVSGAAHTRTGFRFRSVSRSERKTVMPRPVDCTE
jgi:hypothetical protein